VQRLIQAKYNLSSKCYSEVYLAGQIAHEYYHILIMKRMQSIGQVYKGSLHEEYIAMLVGDIVRAQIIEAGYGNADDMRHPISDFTVDLGETNMDKLSRDLYQWFNNYPIERVYIDKYNLDPLPTWLSRE